MSAHTSCNWRRHIFTWAVIGRYHIVVLLLFFEPGWFSEVTVWFLVFILRVIILLCKDTLYVGGFLGVTERFISIRNVVLTGVEAEIGERIHTVLALGRLLEVTGAIGGLVGSLWLLRFVHSFFGVICRQKPGPRWSQIALEVSLSGFVGLFEVFLSVNGKFIVFGPLVLATSVVLGPLSFGTISINILSVLTLVLAKIGSLVIAVLVAVVRVTVFLGVTIVFFVLGVNVLWRVLAVMWATVIVIILMITTIVIHIIMFLVVSFLGRVIVFRIFLVVGSLSVGGSIVSFWSRCIEIAPSTQLAVNLSSFLRLFSWLRSVFALVVMAHKVVIIAWVKLVVWLLN